MGELIAIDVGTTELGVAIFKNCKKRIERPCFAFVLKGNYKAEWDDRLREMGDDLEQFIHDQELEPEAFVLEQPELRGGAAGHAARQAVMQLAVAVGYHMAQAQALGAKTILAPVSQWKGSLPKEVVQRRLEKALGDPLLDGQSTRITSHAIDAVGIGLFGKGFPMNDKAFANAVYKPKTKKRRKA